MTTLLNGLFGGLIIGTLAAVTTRFMAGDPSKTATVSGRIIGTEGSISQRMWLTAQMAYGSFAGGLLVAFELMVLQVLAIPPTTSEALGLAVAWSTVLFIVMSFILLSTVSHDDLRPRLDELLVYHVIYGLGLGVWIRITWIT